MSSIEVDSFNHDPRGSLPLIHQEQDPVSLLKETLAHEGVAQIEQFLDTVPHSTPEIREIVPGFYFAYAWGLASSSAIAVEGGKIIIDCMEGTQAAREVREQFDRLIPGPVKAVILTHGHQDHVGGIGVFLDKDTVIYAHEKIVSEINQRYGILAVAMRDRASKQYGLELDPELVGPCAIGPRLRLDEGAAPPMHYPHTVFVGELKLNIGGVDLELHEAPGETCDHILVWFPKSKVLFPGDNIYKSYPNVYPIRGDTPRSALDWVKSLDLMRSFPAEHLVPGHTENVSGRERIHRLLTDYRDGIACVHDAVVQGINAGRSLDDLVRDIKLPAHLASHPYLQELYGKVSWSVRGIYHGYIGWFDGNPTHLDTLHPQEFANHLLPMCGGREKVIEKISTIFDEGADKSELQFVAQMSDLLLAQNPQDKFARAAKVRALEMMAHFERNTNARTYMFAAAHQIEEGRTHPVLPKVSVETLRAVPVEVILNSFPRRLMLARTINVEADIGFEFTDSKRDFTFHIRHGVGELSQTRAEHPYLRFVATEGAFKAFVTRAKNPVIALFSGDIRLEGGSGRLDNFRRLRTFRSYMLRL